MRTGRVASLGRRPGEAEWRALSPADWNDLELSHRVLEETEGEHERLGQALSEGASFEPSSPIGRSVLVATRIKRRGIPEGPQECLLIQVSRADILREAADARGDDATAPEAEVGSATRQPFDTELDAILRRLEKDLAKIPAQKIALKIARESFPQVSREQVVKRHQALFPNAETGPRGPWKNRPE
jgi:hypothetical protein